jgi:hypothetical protein
MSSALHPGKCFEIFHRDKILVKCTKQEIAEEPVADSNTKRKGSTETKNTANKKKKIDNATSAIISIESKEGTIRRNNTTADVVGFVFLIDCVNSVSVYVFLSRIGNRYTIVSMTP